ncbi:MAG: beta-N-acetylhexosaminidase [SAR86 cluster bacterium]|uniref:beta-N-acetylhexosaminidase n=1 Tax=SAR86 cluster bacterium TaxID=2030880 RepID=A0A2A5AKL8_9GAMM|nr:MAG: beta-N-acetylhexosaminidase [SAR86 cluster bacterium]
MLDVSGLILTPNEKELLQRPCVGGVILFSRNYANPGQLRELVAAIKDCNGNLLVAVDQEGGRVQRFREPFLKLPALHDIGDIYEQDKERGIEVAKQCAWAMAAEVLHYGIDFSFAPVLDVYSNNSRVIKERAFAASAEQTGILGRAYIEGMHEAGMAATGKHFPGHGTVVADSHEELPVDGRPIEQIRELDIKAFAACIDSLDAIMPAHVIYPAVDSVCAGFSRVWLQTILREELGFDGVVFSDDLSMNAAHAAGSVTQRANLALSAGCDMVLVCNDPDSAVIVADWLEARNYPASSKLSRMLANPCAEISNLYSESKWLELSHTVSGISA